MENEIAIYVRPSGDDTYLHFHVPTDRCEALFSGFKNGSFENTDTDIHLEISILPEWITDESQREQLTQCTKVVHLRIPITRINVIAHE